MTALTKAQVIQQLNATDRDLFCEWCYSRLEETTEGTLYCPNDMCMNEQHYTKDGEEIEENRILL